MSLMKIAWRNLRRNLRRNLITGTAIGFGLILLLISDGISVGTFGTMIDTGIRQMAGHVVVQGEGYQEDRDSKITVPETLKIETELKKAFPEATVLKRVFLDGLLNSPTGSVGIALTAVDVAIEQNVGDLHTKIVEGSYLDGAPSQIVIGKSLAETLSVGLGDKVVLMSSQNGEIESRLFRVKGLFRSGQDQLDGFYAQIPIQDGQALLAMGDNVSQISVHLDRAEASEAATATTKSLLTTKGIEILSWSESLPELNQFVQLKLQSNYMMMGVIAFIVCMGILNTSLMSVLERMREFGVMLAVGMAPSKLALLVLIEAGLLGLCSVAGGMAVGLSLNGYFTKYGLDYSQMIGETMEAGGVGISSHIYAAFDWNHIILFGVISVLLTLLASVYPAIKAARLEPVEAMHHV